MILRELFYFNRETDEMENDNRYEPSEDSSPVKIKDTRKTRLTLKQINRIRKASDASEKEKAEELVFVRQMYGLPAQEDAAV